MALARSLMLCGMALLAGWRPDTAWGGEPAFAIAMQGQPALAPGFAAFPYANPNAPKGGQLVQGALGTFDSLNPFIIKGQAAISLRGYVVESLLTRSYDEPFTLYGLLAKSVETASNMPMFLILLTFLSSSFVLVASMPGALRWFAENQPFTAVTDTVRNLLANQHVGSAGLEAVVWCLAITAAGYLWARYLYNRRPVN